MPRIKEDDRKRTRTPKVRTGCGTCKIRRVKCDETKPICRKCVDSKVKCDGYKPPIQRECSLKPGPSVAISQDPKELRSFQFYQHKTVKQLTSTFTESFWSSYILQFAQKEPSIQHGIFALAAIHEQFLNQDKPEEDVSEFALSQYNRSIRNLLNNPGSTFIQLLSGLIFMSIETLQGHYAQAVKLYKHARALFEQVQLDESQILHIGDQFVEVEDFMRRLALHMNQGLPEIDTDPRQIVGDVDQDLNIETLHVPQAVLPLATTIGPFSTFNQARVSIEKLVYAYTKATNSANPTPLLTALDDKISRWKTSLATLIEKTSSLSPSQKRSIALLNMYGVQVELFQLAEHSGAAASDALFWDHYCDQMSLMVDFAAEAVSYQSKEEGGAGAISFSYDIGVVGALMGVVTRCRDPVVRRKAISILRSSHRQECLWNSKMVADSAERFIQLEEGDAVVASCVDILPSSRLKFIHFVLGQGAKDAAVEYGFLVSGRVVRRDITW